MLVFVTSFLAVYACFRRLCSRYGEISIFLHCFTCTAFDLRASRHGRAAVRVFGFSGWSYLIPDVWCLTTVSNTAVVVVVVVSHIQRIGCQPGKNYFTRWPIPLVVC